MIPQQGGCYFIRDDFFVRFPTDHILQNKPPAEGHSGYRPHFCAFRDRDNPEIFWMIPLTTKAQKYSALAAEKQAKFGECNTIRFATVQGNLNVFLIQNMIPVTQEYIFEQYFSKHTGKPVRLTPKSERDILAKAKQVIRLHRRNKPILFPDVDFIKNKLLMDKLREQVMAQQNAQAHKEGTPSSVGPIAEKRMALAIGAFRDEMERSDRARTFFMDVYGNALGFRIIRESGKELWYNAETSAFCGSPAFKPLELPDPSHTVTCVPYIFAPQGVLHNALFERTLTVCRSRAKKIALSAQTFENTLTVAQKRRPQKNIYQPKKRTHLNKGE